MKLAIDNACRLLKSYDFQSPLKLPWRFWFLELDSPCQLTSEIKVVKLICIFGKRATMNIVQKNPSLAEDIIEALFSKLVTRKGQQPPL